MPILKNGKHERFAQGLAAGKSASDAYKGAGFAASYPNSSRLQRKDHIGQRVAEILDQKRCAADKAMATAAEKAGLDHFWVLRSLRRNATMAARAGDRAASNRAVELIGRHLGVFIDKKEIEINVMDDADRYLQQLLELVGPPVIEHEPLTDEQRREAAYLATNERHPLPLSGTEDGQKYGASEEAEPDAIDIAAEPG
jgi:hypothetical protein